MKQRTAHFAGYNMVFDIYHGIVQGYNTFVESTTSLTGGGGKIRTSDWTGKVSGTIKPVETTTKHTHYTEFFIQEEDGREISIRLIDTLRPFRNGQQVTVYRAHDTGQFYKIINHNSGTSTLVTRLGTIVSQSPHFFRKLIKHNNSLKVLWYVVLATIIGWCGWILWDVFTHDYDWLTIFIAVLFMIPPYLLYKVTRRGVVNYLAKGLAKEVGTWNQSS